MRDSEGAAMVSCYIICVVPVRNIKHSLTELLIIFTPVFLSEF
jgi:hypothetical protein